MTQGSGSLILACRTDKRSAKAAEILENAGGRRLAVLRGGMEAWNQMGLPVEHVALTEPGQRTEA